MKEVWFDIPELGGAYQITRGGKIRRLGRVVHRKNGAPMMVREKELTPYMLPIGYSAVSISMDGKKMTLYMHRLLAGLFIKKPFGKNEINHIDGNKGNNSLENLEWCTHQENMEHAAKTGLSGPSPIGPGERCPAAKLNDVKVKDIKERLVTGEKQKYISNIYGVSQGTIGSISTGKTWGHVK